MDTAKDAVRDGWGERGLGPYWLFILIALVGLHAGAFEPLPRAAPESLGISGAGIDGFLRELDQVRGAQSVVVVHRDRIVAEAYWTGSASTLRHVRSLTKSVSSTLIGIAVDRGSIAGIDSRMNDYLPPALVPSGAAKDKIRLIHLLTHTSGLRWEENGEFSTWAASHDPVRYILDRPLVTKPGNDFNYSTPGTHVLSAVLEEAVGVDSEAYADAFLFRPLGITSWRWQRDRQGYPFGGHGLELRTEDSAKLGVLFLNRGRWGDEQVVSAAWVRSATAVHYQGSSEWGQVQNVSYGLLWWLVSAGEIDIFMALGWGGQFVICVPVLDLVVATNARWQVDAATADAQERAILGVVVERLLPLISARYRTPRRSSGRVRPPLGSSDPKAFERVASESR